ncbi:GTPase Era [Paludibacter sp.]
MHKSGFVNIVGNPNVGKSTLMNALVGERISIITSKAQTTRHRILGIVNGDDFQIVYSDTPGVIQPNYRLQESMRKFSNSALTDADVLLYVTDVFDSSVKNSDFIERVAENPAHLILIINKIDLIDQSKLEDLVEKWKQLLPSAKIFPVSATERFNIEPLFNEIKDLLPESPPFFEKDQLTDKPARFFVTEIIREKILLNYDKEIPYAVEVVVEQFQEDERIIRINAIINVERESQKGIIIGHGGKSLKKVGMDARKDLEVFFEKKIFLELFVKVEKDWRNKEMKLRGFGYSLD